MILHLTIEGPRDAGANGARVLLLHPVGIDSTFLAGLSAALAKGFRVMRMDLRGHGRSPAGSPNAPAAGTLDEFAEDVHETLAQQHFAPCTVIGFSFGGMVGQTLAINHPADVAALIPCACPCVQTPQSSVATAARGTDALKGGMAAVLEATLERWFNAPFRAAGGDAAARKYLSERDPRGWAQGWAAISKINTLAKLPALRMPVHCIAGELDKSSPPTAVEKIYRAVPGATMTVLPGAPHMLFIEQPEATATEILLFLHSLKQRGAAA